MNGQSYPRGRVAYTLLEVVLALAIAAAAAAMLAQLVGLANQSAASSRDLTKAQLIAESVMAEVAAGVQEPVTSSGNPWDLDPDWTYDVQVAQGASENLNIVTVTASLAIDTQNPVTFSLSQFLFIPPEVIDDETSTTEDTDAGGGV